jgi:hypothetical protein
MLVTINTTGSNVGTGSDVDSTTVEDFDMTTVDFGDEHYDHRCRACSELVNSTGEDGDDDECQENEQEDGGFGAHDPVPTAFNWVKHAGVSVNEADDSVTLHISVGDPRGAFRFTLRRIPADADGELAGKVIMHVPYPGEPTPHVPLTDLHTGTYIVGS